MCHTNKARVKSDSLATLKHTPTHFVMVSLKDIASTLAIHLQGELVFHYTRHMPTEQLP
jgi:hypothetical protein